ncbi:YicC/YloC family endoribonuclease [Acidiphilium sp.]|uniref:YicC/YloC family endoribonuclease n=1 Tax=Acidiphilium sp. TaxID=527 RepID=UPI003D02FF4F
MNISSMTGFARAAGQHNAIHYAWELRSVNGRGFDLKLRLPPGFDALEPALREAAARRLKRGTISVGLTLRRDAPMSSAVDESVLDLYLARALDLARRIPGMPTPRAEALMALPGVIRPTGGDAGEPEDDEVHQAALASQLALSFEAALADLVAARDGEGARLAVVIDELLARIATLTTTAWQRADAQIILHRARLETALATLLGESRPVAPERLAQEIALLATKSDVREELDRLDAHIAAARALLGEAAPIGRRFDFLTQEFNREANTLCSKSASIDLTAIGLELKAAIEQLREQVQNIE